MVETPGRAVLALRRWLVEPHDQARHDAHLGAYDLFAAVQGADHLTAARSLAAATRVADECVWPEVSFVLGAAHVVHRLTRPAAALTPATTAVEPTDVTALVHRAEHLAAPALLALALGIRAVAAAVSGDMARLMVDASRAVGLLDDQTQPALDRCAGYVVTAAAYNSLRLWELVDELYTRAGDLEPLCGVAAQAPAIAVNRVLTRLEWGLALLENGDGAQARDQLRQAALAVPAALSHDLPALWRWDVEACAEIVRLLCEPGATPGPLDHRRSTLAASGDTEVLPLLQAAGALALCRAGLAAEAVAAASTPTLPGSTSSGALTFPLWVRATVLAATDPSPAVRAMAEHAALLGRLRWQSRGVVLVAARSQIASERRRAEHAWLAHAVNVDALTGLHNRRSFNTWLERPRAVEPPPTALLLVDLDRFKEVNDTYGHECGDAVLRRLGQILHELVRPGDIAVRHGGDEFAILIEDDHLTLASVHQRAHDLQAAIGSEPWHELADGLTVSASLGGVVAPAASAEVSPLGARALYRAADAALYTAKRDGSGVHVLPAV